MPRRKSTVSSSSRARVRPDDDDDDDDDEYESPIISAMARLVNGLSGLSGVAVDVAHTLSVASAERFEEGAEDEDDDEPKCSVRIEGLYPRPERAFASGKKRTNSKQ